MSSSQLLTVLALFYQLAIAAAAVFLLVLAWRYVRAHERIADALERRIASRGDAGGERRP